MTSSQAVRRAFSAAAMSIVACAVSACGGGGGGAQHSLVPVPVTGPAQHGRLTFSFTVPKKTSRRTRVPQYVSASTQAVEVIVTSQSSQQTTTDVVPCTSTCTGSLNAPAGVDSVTFKLIDKPPVGNPPSADPTAKRLAIGTVVALIVADTDNVVKATLDGVVKNIAMGLAPSVVNAGTAANTFLIVNAYDPDDNLITFNGAWIDDSGAPVVVDVTAPLPNILAGISGSLITVSAPGAVIPVAGTFAAGTYPFTAALRTGAPTVTAIAPASLVAQPSVVFGTTPAVPRSSLLLDAFTRADGSVGLAYLGPQASPQLMIADVLGRPLITGPVYSGPFGMPPLVPQPGLVDIPSGNGADQAFVIASSTFINVTAPACTGGSLPLYSGPVDASTGAAPFTLCDNGVAFSLTSASQSYALPGYPDPFPAAFIASPVSNTSAWCNATKCFVLGSGASGIVAVVTDTTAATVGNASTTTPGQYAAYDVDHALLITPQGAVYQRSSGGSVTTQLYQSGVQSPDAICKTADGTTTVVLGNAIVGGIAQPRIGVYRNGAETLGPIPPSPGFLNFVPGANCKFVSDDHNVDAVLF